ncbi:hypothetical protein Afil01_24270 [Actinorhabdospora filicis]|uniref:Hsp70 protein n=1 Tax=Actinorhabdospora filicis TaxID=1785913 RepID=A0A9W6SIC0_9ACTN|nr:Hsp70 family protein [Actinorhabdospora filicis]GLZ77620.1 hypothetical protein Afil01_24270 [Actinorhabdospora filicis]
MSAHLGIDFGTSHTVAVLRRADGRVEALTFDGSPLMPSAVHAGTTVNVGLDALHAARSNPAAVEPHPKRRVDDGTVLLGDREFSVAQLFAAVLTRVRERCVEVGRTVPSSVTITHPAAWGPTRRAVLRDAASRAGLPGARLLPEPVAAAAYYTGELGVDVPDGSAVAVHDFGGGTFDASVVRRVGDGFEVLAVDGLADLGGVDLDEALIRHLRATVGEAEAWTRLLEGEDLATRRARAAFRNDVRAAKERLSRQTVAELYIPVVDVDAHLTREELETVVAPLLERAMTVTHAVLAEAAVPPERRAGVFLVGGGSRMPLVATLLHRVLGAAPTLTDDVEQVVARGAILDEDVKRSRNRNPLPAGAPMVDGEGERNRNPLPQAGPVPHSAPPAPAAPGTTPPGVPVQPTGPAYPQAAASPGHPAAPPAGRIAATAPVYSPPHPGAPISGGPISGGPVSAGPISGAPISGGPTSPPPFPGHPAPMGDRRPLALRAALPILLTQLACVIISGFGLNEDLDHIDEWPDVVAIIIGMVSLTAVIAGISTRLRAMRPVAVYGQIGMALFFTYSGSAATEWIHYGSDEQITVTTVPLAVAILLALVNVVLLTAPATARWYRHGVPGETPRRWPYWAVVFAAGVIAVLLVQTLYGL